MPQRLACVAAALLAAAGPASAQLVAERITPENAAQLQLGGPDADGGVGDWALQNGTLCAVIADAAHEAPISPQGGALADLVRCGNANDQWSALVPLVNLSRASVVPVTGLRAERDERAARIVAEGGRPGLRIRTTYSLDLATPDELSVTTELTRGEGGDRTFAFGEVIFHASGQLRPFSLLRRDLAHSVGFSHPSGDPSSPLTMLRGIVAADAHVLVGGEGIEPGLSYGVALRRAELRRAGGAIEPVATFAITGESFTMTGVFAESFWVGGGAGAPGMLELAQLPLMDLDTGDVLVVERTIRVGERADVASVTDAYFAGGAAVSGRVDDPSARIHVATAAGAPVSEVRPGADGAFSLRLPAGAYRLRAIAPGGREQVREIAVGAAPLALEPIAVGAMARVILPRGRTQRLVFVGEAGTPDPRFDDDLLGFRVNGAEIPSGSVVNAVSLAGLASDPREVALAPGRYRVLATRGPEYDVHETRLEVRAGDRLELAIDAPERALETPGWIAADFHVHSAESFDASWPHERQLAAFAANGAEVLVATEHDRIFDPRPSIARLGLGDRLVGIVGVEITGAFEGGDTPYTIGHLNAYPMQRDPLAWRGGAPRTEGRRVRAVLADLGRGDGAPFVQMNHPRGHVQDQLEDSAYFTHLAVAGEPYDPAQGLAAEPNRVLAERDPASGLRDLDYDGVELLNGPSLDRYRLTRADWLSLLLQGVVHVGLGNSDSHRAGELPGLPRNYVPLADDALERFDEAAFFAAVRAGRVVATTGPLLDAKLGEAGPGERFVGRVGRAARAGGSGALGARGPAARPPRRRDRRESLHRARRDAGAAARLRARRLRGGRGGGRARRDLVRARAALRPVRRREPDLRGRRRRRRLDAARLAGSRRRCSPIRYVPASARRNNERIRGSVHPDAASAQDLRPPVPVAHGSDPRRGGLAARAARDGAASRARGRGRRSDHRLHPLRGRARRGGRLDPRHRALREAEGAHDRDGLGRERRHAHLPGGRQEGPLLPAEHALHDPPAARRHRRQGDRHPDRGRGDPEGARAPEPHHLRRHRPAARARGEGHRPQLLDVPRRGARVRHRREDHQVGFELGG